MDDDYIRFCIKCGWNDIDFGCICPDDEEVYQCPLYIHYNPDEVKEFEEWIQKC